jgi:uncharacterized protein DUF1592/uncharacterized protein DUF1588/uncharacterized protein DUF1595/uncharacterized protein DUF1587
MKTKLDAKTLALMTVLGAAACLGNVAAPREIQSSSGSVGGSSSGASASSGTAGGLTSASSGAGGDSGAAASQCAEGASFASARLSLITDDQYRNIVHDVFGVTFPASVVITAPPSTTGSYSYNENAQVETTTVQAYQRAADQVAALMTSIPGCTAGINTACMQQYLQSNLQLAWRRPVTDAEISGLMAIFDSASMDGQARQVQLTMEAALIHPAFLYRSEIGANAATAAGKVSLTPYELASAVSFALLNSSPDAELWAKAQDGSIVQPSVLATEVARLIALPAVQANLTKLVSYYLDFETLPFTSKDATAYPEFASLQGTLYQSSQLFLNDVMWGGHFSDLFTSRRIYANEAMATAYGLPPVTGTQLQPITTVGDAYGGGVLTQPALLAASNKNAVGDDVIHRGLWVYYNLLCAPALPPPPANAAAVAATFTGSTRQQSVLRDTTCGAGCHGRFDPFGLVTLSYDGIGRYRTTDPTTTPPGGPIDDSATVPAGVLTDQPRMPIMLSGVGDVAKLFVTGRQVSDCAADNLATYALEHSPDVEGSCDLQNVKDRFQQSGSFPDLFTSILTSPAFLTRDL